MAIRVRQRLGKYRIDRRLGEGGYAAVYQATDTIEGIRVALKIPHPQFVSKESLEQFRKEVRLAAKLNHPNVLPLKNADMIDGHFVVAYPLASETLGDRLQRRMSIEAAMELVDQMVDAVAHAHECGIIHCDIKPENFLLFPDHVVMLTDFGIARMAVNTMTASGSGTVGYLAPEQAMGKPSPRSDVFSLALVIYRMLTGHLPRWPFDWPPPGYERLRKYVNKDFIAVLKKSMDVDPRNRYRDAIQMQSALARVRSNAVKHQTRAGNRNRKSTARTTDWRTIRQRQFVREYRTVLELHHKCSKCNGPISEAMQFCPWCKTSRKKHDGGTKMPQACPRCHRGLKLDWAYCPWCFGPGFEVQTDRQYRDKRYTARCRNAACPRKELMPFMRYCPWCRTKVRRAWPIPGEKSKCKHCSWGVVPDYWECCPWCGKGIAK